MHSITQDINPKYVGVLGILILILGGLHVTNPVDRLHQLHQDHPLIQAYQESVQSQDTGWLKLKNSAPMTQSRLKKLIVYMVDQFGLEVKQIRFEEVKIDPLIQWKIHLIIGAVTDLDIWELYHYLEKELAPLVKTDRFSLHRSGSLDETMLQQGQIPNLVEGRFELDWITK